MNVVAVRREIGTCMWFTRLWDTGSSARRDKVIERTATHVRSLSLAILQPPFKNISLAC